MEMLRRTFFGRGGLCLLRGCGSWTGESSNRVIWQK